MRNVSFIVCVVLCDLWFTYDLIERDVLFWGICVICMLFLIVVYRCDQVKLQLQLK
jgi:hypothetical protein